MISTQGDIFILDVRIDNVTLKRGVDIAYNLVNSSGVYSIFTPNPEILMNAQKCKKLKDVLNSSSLNLPDGIGVVLASKILNCPVEERVGGFDFVCMLFEKLRHTEVGIFLLGAKPGVAERAKNNLEKSYPGLRISGFHHGYFFNDYNSKNKLIKKINESNSKLLLVCLGSPLQEYWIYENKNKLNVNLSIGLGGAFDIFSGDLKRAPEYLINLNFEWVYRAFKEPKRLKRLFKLPVFAAKILQEKIKQNKIVGV